MFAALVQPQVITSLHVQDVQVRISVAIDVERGGVAAPALVDESDIARHIPEPIAAEVMIKNARLGALGMQMPHERVAESDEITPGSALVRGIDADVGDEEIEQAVAVVVEKDRTRRVADVADASRLGDVAKFSAAQILEEMVAVPHR